MRNPKFLLFLFVVSLLFIAGCQTTTRLYKGARAEDKTIVSLNSAAEMQRWQDLYVKVDYNFQRQQQQLLVDGFFEFSDYPQMNLSLAHDFKLKLFMLDENNLVLDYFDLYRHLGGQLDRRETFRRTFTVPDGTVNVAFGYEGRFIGRHDDGEEYVWKLPRRQD